MKSRDVIFTGLQSWDITIGSNAKNIATHMSRDNRVLYVNPPRPMINSVRSAPRGLREVSPNLYVVDLPVALLSINTIGWPLLFDRLNRYNNVRIAAAVLETAKELWFHRFIHINDNDLFRSFYMRDFLRPALSVYYRRDWLLDVPYWHRHGRRLEPLLAAKSDLVLTNSPYLADTIRPFNPNSYYVGQGVDLTLYNPSLPHPTPPELAHLPRPLIGYTGALSALRLDADLIADVAGRMSDVTFVMVGPEDDFFRHHHIHRSKNVLFLGPRDPAVLADYIAAFDLCINPQTLNPTTAGNYPRKIDEYLAMGKSIVATDTPTMEIFEPYVSLCKDADQYVAAIRSALDSDNQSDRNQRTKFAQTHSWHNSIEQMYRYIDPLIR